MKNKFLTSLFVSLITVFNCYSQTKKEQIKQLSHRLDSLSNIAAIREITIDSLNVIHDKLKQNIEQISIVLSTRNKLIMDLESKIKKMDLENTQQKNQYTSNINLLKDSLNQMSLFSNISEGLSLTDFLSSDKQSELSLNNEWWSSFNFDFLSDADSTSINLTGKFVSYWPDSWNEIYANSKKIEYANGQLKNGLKNGYWKYRLCNGDISTEGSYVNGLKNGSWINYNPCNSSGEYFSNLYVDLDYYEFNEWHKDILKEEIIYKNGIPLDTFYYKNSKNELKYKINHKTAQIFYDNNQPFTNNTSKIGSEETIIFNRNGSIKYKMTISGNQRIELFNNSNGYLIKKCIYINDIGECDSFDLNGKITFKGESGISEFGTGKFGVECPCQ